MERVSDIQLQRLIGGQAREYTSCADVQKDANEHAKEWGDEEWDEWLRGYDTFC